MLIRTSMAHICCCRSSAAAAAHIRGRPLEMLQLSIAEGAVMMIITNIVASVATSPLGKLFSFSTGCTGRMVA
jgi:hypothetical protein